MFAELLQEIVLEIHGFNMFDIVTICTLALLEGILSVDNALVLAILVKKLPDKKQQKRALTWGIWGAFIFRVIAIIFATYIMKWWYFKLFGGAYLIFLSMKHMFLIGSGSQTDNKKKDSPVSFWYIIILVELTDIVFSIDSITTAVAMTDKIVIIWIGGILGIIFMRVLSGFFIGILEKFPRTEDLAYQLVFFVGTKLAFESMGIHFTHKVFWLMMGVILIIGASLIYKDYKQAKTGSMKEEKLIKGVKNGESTIEEMLKSQEMISSEFIWKLIEDKYIYIRPKQNLYLLKDQIQKNNKGSEVK